MPAVNPSSPFAAVLRRSKFATFDPAIGQVYTSHGGHLHRGNWGFKRPIPLRTKGAHITVTAIDSRQEQTEWKWADREARFVKMWDEVGVTPVLSEQGSWATKLGVRALDMKLDSEFEDQSSMGNVTQSSFFTQIHGPISPAVPNVASMTDKEFENYLRKLRKLRPAFKEYIKEITARQAERDAKEDAMLPAEFNSFWERSWQPGRDHKLFLASKAYHEYNSPESRTIEQQPQTFAGLAYGKSSRLQSHLFNKPKPGRVLELEGGSLYSSFAGTKALVDAHDRRPDSSAAFERQAKGEPDPHAGVVDLKITRATLYYAPQTVGRNPEGLMRAQIEVSVATGGGEDMQRANAHTPGTREYVAHSTTVVAPGGILARPPRKMPTAKQAEEQSSSSSILNTLQNIVSSPRRQ